MTEQLAIEGGAPVRSAPWPSFAKGINYLADSDEKAGEEVLRSRRLHRYDDRPQSATECGALEGELAAFFGTRYSLTATNGTAAISLALLSLGLNPGAEVACSGFTFTATPSAILQAGLRPLLIDVDDDLHMDVESLERSWHDGIEAIVIVHMRGLAAPIERVLEFARKKGVPVVEDAVPVLGGSQNGKKLGTFGTVGAFSMQSGKMLNTGEGGFIVTDDPIIYQRAVVAAGGYETHLERHVERPDIDWRTIPVFNFRMDEVRAALARSELARLPERVAHQAANHALLEERLGSLDGIRVRRAAEPDAVVGDSLILIVDGDAERAPALARALSAEGVDARGFGDPDRPNARCFWNWNYLWPGSSEADRRSVLPRAAHLLDRAIDIPLSHALTAADCEQLVEAVEKVLSAGL